LAINGVTVRNAIEDQQRFGTGFHTTVLPLLVARYVEEVWIEDFDTGEVVSRRVTAPKQ